ncbi:RNA ligase family protein [Micromonospora sp. DSM 115977]|uniref:RNA ligase family protein n=1 Tax=Micromonospora reichwaldensis TaxID=3075516 RepID=A0ABU2WXE9_9ACTN|nr:RNA ligase family protein [Micromonospora sp. DSM 115977]MDT0530611.1 RNA ligase family protein [Micromonospora sp. DSM 115977]
MSRLDVRTVDLRKINSLTKYPSIPTYHALDPDNGGLLAECVAFTGPVTLTEKVDGTNARIVVLPDGAYLIGSREELLYARGDLIGNPALGIVDALRDVAERLTVAAAADRITVFYLEVYGGKVTAASRQYTAERRVGHRLFDVAVLDDPAPMLDWPAQRISAWRDGGGQRFLGEADLVGRADASGLATVPRLATVPAEELPRDIEGMHTFLTGYLPRTLVALDGPAGRSEGLVLRAADRSAIAKARFQDYERTLKRRVTRR